jgi:hypothetical protein
MAKVVSVVPVDFAVSVYPFYASEQCSTLATEHGYGIVIGDL